MIFEGSWVFKKKPKKTNLKQCGLIAFLSASSYMDYFIIKTRLQTLPGFTAECMKHREWTEDIFGFKQRNLVLVYSGMGGPLDDCSSPTWFVCPICISTCLFSWGPLAGYDWLKFHVKGSPFQTFFFWESWGVSSAKCHCPSVPIQRASKWRMLRHSQQKLLLRQSVYWILNIILPSIEVFA